MCPACHALPWTGSHQAAQQHCGCRSGQRACKIQFCPSLTLTVSAAYPGKQRHSSLHSRLWHTLRCVTAARSGEPANRRINASRGVRYGFCRVAHSAALRAFLLALLAAFCCFCEPTSSPNHRGWRRARGVCACRGTQGAAWGAPASTEWCASARAGARAMTCERETLRMHMCMRRV